MVLTRLGNKKIIAPELYQYFPPHRLRITLFFGAGGMFFNTPRARFNVVNDLDDDVSNLYLVISEQSDELIEEIQMMPISATLLKYWNENPPIDRVKKAARFLLMSNCTYLGKGDTIRYGVGLEKSKMAKRIKETFLHLGDTRIMTEDFRKVIPKISFSKNVLKRSESFVYLDPVYLGTGHYYRVPNWTEQDTFDCFEIMSNEGIPAAMSEFKHPYVMEQARSRGFTIIPISERRNIKNTRTEILITNYKPQNLLF